MPTEQPMAQDAGDDSDSNNANESWEMFDYSDESRDGIANQLQQDETEGATNRFIRIRTEDDMDKLASERQAKLTVNQTRWAVRIFKGEF